MDKFIHFNHKEHAFLFVSGIVDHLFDLTAYFADELALAGISVVNPPCINQFMIKGRDEEETERILRHVQNSGECWCGGSVWKGEPVIRVSVCSHATTKEDIDRSVHVFKQAREFTQNTLHHHQ